VERLLPCSTPGPPEKRPSVAPHTFETFKQEAEKNFLLQKLRDHDWNVSETARTLRMPRSNLYKKIERYGLRRESA
jgi:two-component system nitrogen regulation response regulator NtrX